MRIIVTRVDARRYATVVERDDGVRLSVPGYGFMHAMPHDLAHYVVEANLRLERGLWGSVAAGAKLRGMQLLSGRQRPHADERAKQVEKANTSFLNEAEQLVACFEALVDQNVRSGTGQSKDAGVMLRRQKNKPTPTQIVEVCAVWRSMQKRWDALAIGEAIELDWLTPRPRRP
jgi:hypothetical protein